MDKLINYFKEINAEFIEKSSSVENKDVPEAMKFFYEKFKSVTLPYGIIYDLETALKESAIPPFLPNWFVFGQDNYFSFWLCYKGDNLYDDCYFTYWDHDSGCEIEEPIWKDLLSFLKEVEEDANDD